MVAPDLSHVNYQHLQYFWTVARAGSVTKAAEELLLAPSTVSAQINVLEASLGQELFRKVGRGLELTEAGQLAFGYAEQIFSLGREMLGALRGRPADRPVRFTVGIIEAVPKLVTRELLRPAFVQADGEAGQGAGVQLVCREAPLEQLLIELAGFRLDLVLTDVPVKPTPNLRSFNHLLGECGVTLFAAPKLADQLRPGFPTSLDGAPALLPGPTTALRGSLEQWFGRVGVRPRVVGEFDDSALVKVFGSDGTGFFAVHSVIADEIARRYEVEPIGRTEGRTERFYAVTGERRIRHPAVVAVTTAARTSLFATA